MKLKVKSQKLVLSFPLLLKLGIFALLLLLLLHIWIGSVGLSLREVIAALLNQPVEEYHRQIVWDLRLPRALIGLVAGAILGLSGAILQAVIRNPLAEPGLTGVSAGGVFLVALWLFLGQEGTYLLPLVALLGGLSAGLLVYALSWQSGIDPVRLVLTGVLVSAMFQSATSVLLLQNEKLQSSILLWIVGSLNGRVWGHWHMLWPWALIALPLGLITAGLANALQLGDDVATSLGLRVERTRAVLLFVAVLLAASAVSVVGAVGFIGLIAPHSARQLVGEDARRVFPLSAVLASGLLLTADLVSRSLMLKLVEQSAMLPVGAVTALLGAPFFIYLLLRSRL